MEEKGTCEPRGLGPVVGTGLSLGPPPRLTPRARRQIVLGDLNSFLSL